jgi:hypothetical protein
MPKVANILKHSDEVNIEEARLILTNEALLRLSTEEVESFEANYMTTLHDYLSDGKLTISSKLFELDKLESCQSWLNILAQERSKYLPLIVAKMMKGDSLSYGIFEFIYNSLGKSENILTLSKYMQDDNLKNAYFNSECGAASEAILNAEYWLNSEEGRSVLCSSNKHDAKLNMIIDHNC